MGSKPRQTKKTLCSDPTEEPTWRRWIGTTDQTAGNKSWKAESASAPREARPLGLLAEPRWKRKDQAEKKVSGLHFSGQVGLRLVWIPGKNMHPLFLLIFPQENSSPCVLCSTVYINEWFGIRMLPSRFKWDMVTTIYSFSFRDPFFFFFF